MSSDSTTMPWYKGTTSRILAALLGSFITTIALTVSITLVWPFGDHIEQIFAGGTFFFVFWASIFYWAILAEHGGRAWLRVFSLLIPALIIDIVSLAL